MRVFLITGFLGRDCFNLLEKYLEEYDYYVALINGHTNDNEIPPYQNWIIEVDEQFQKFKENGEVFLIGFSMGAIIANYIYMKYPSYVRGIIFISPAFYHHYFNNIDFNIIKEIRIPKRFLSYKNKKVLFGLKELNKLSGICKKNSWLEQIKVPVLLIIGSKDGLLEKNSGEKIMKRIYTPIKYLNVYDSKHNVFESKSKDEICVTIKSFMNYIGG